MRTLRHKLSKPFDLMAGLLLIAGAGANGFSPPTQMRADQIFVRGVRLPFLKFPRSPNL